MNKRYSIPLHPSISAHDVREAIDMLGDMLDHAEEGRMAFEHQHNKSNGEVTVNGAPLRDLFAAQKILKEFYSRLKGTDYYWHSKKDVEEDPIKDLVQQVELVMETIKWGIEKWPVGEYIDRLSAEEKKQLFS